MSKSSMVLSKKNSWVLGEVNGEPVHCLIDSDQHWSYEVGSSEMALLKLSELIDDAFACKLLSLGVPTAVVFAMFDYLLQALVDLAVALFKHFVAQPTEEKRQLS